jgi:lysine-specific demethylase/histidyl-hydroxylase NO66
MRLLKPQEFSASLAKLLSLSDELFACDTGVNAYITPAAGEGGAQGFAPHFDDIDAYLIQLEGAKKWKLMLPPNPADVLCLEPSVDFKKEDLEGQEPLFSGILKKGDLLYMPRGVVHFGKTVAGMGHSTHVTLSN